MNEHGKLIKKLADILAIILIIMIIGGIINATGLLGAIISPSDEDAPTEELILNPTDVYELDMEVGSASIAVVKSDLLKIEAASDSFRLRNKDGKIKIEEKSNFLVLNTDRKVTIYLPEDFYFHKVSLETGASNISGELLNTQYLELDIGAGLITLDELNVTKKAEIDCGAGELVLKGGTLHNLDFSLGVGSADICAELKSNADIESGVGELKLNLTDSKDNYTFNVETGIGSISYDGASVKGDTRLGNGETRVKLEGGVGSVEIAFGAAA